MLSYSREFAMIACFGKEYVLAACSIIYAAYKRGLITNYFPGSNITANTSRSRITSVSVAEKTYRIIHPEDYTTSSTMSPKNTHPPKALQFINISNPEARKRASKHRATIRSHAARTTHAAARQARMLAYQAGKIVSPPQRSLENGKYGVDRGVQPAPRTTPDKKLEWEKEVAVVAIVVPSPFEDVPGSRSKDPFESFVASFTPTQQFLLYHCKYDGVPPVFCCLSGQASSAEVAYQVTLPPRCNSRHPAAAHQLHETNKSRSCILQQHDNGMGPARSRKCGISEWHLAQCITSPVLCPSTAGSAAAVCQSGGPIQACVCACCIRRHLLKLAWKIV